MGPVVRGGVPAASDGCWGLCHCILQVWEAWMQWPHACCFRDTRSHSGVSLQAPCCLMRLRLQGLEELEMLLELCPLLFSPLHGVFPSFPKSAPPLALSSWVQKPCPEWRGAGFPDCPASAALQVCEQGLGTVPVPQGVRAVGVVLCSSAVLSHKPTAFPESFLEPHQGKRIPVTRDSFYSPFWLLYQITMDWVACKPRN